MFCFLFKVHLEYPVLHKLVSQHCIKNESDRGSTTYGTCTHGRQTIHTSLTGMFIQRFVISAQPCCEVVYCTVARIGIRHALLRKNCSSSSKLSKLALKILCAVIMQLASIHVQWH